MNEEEIKIKIILPFLSKLGFKEDSLSFEKSFKIQFGRGRQELGESISGKPRLDILVKENDQNRFVIEVKTDEKELDDEDKWQAISYARLSLPELCPYAIITNGKETKIFDSYDGTELTETGVNVSKFVKNGYKLQLDSELQSQAIARLITLSYDNLLVFCKYQIDDTLSRLRTTEKESLKKYIPEVFVNRNVVQSAFHEFLESNFRCLIISGEAGVGKTNSVCSLAETAKNDHPCLFYNSAELANSLDDCLATDFNWEFSSSKPPEQYIKQLNDILQIHKKDLIIFVDAIDEWPITNVEINLSDFVKRITDKKIRLIVSCKNTKILGFLTNKGIPTILAQNTFKASKTSNDLQLMLEKFSNDEVVDAARKYKGYFSILNEISGKTLEECKDPSMLRAISEIYSEKDVPSTLDSVKIYQKYLDNKLEKAPNKSRALQFLTDLTKDMFDEKCDEIFESDLSNTDSEAKEFCIESNIISRIEDAAGRLKLRFNSDGLRNYIITYHKERLDELNVEKIKEFANKHVPTPCGRDVIKWYADQSETKHEKILRSCIEDADKRHAITYIDKFTSIAKQNFPFVLKNSSGNQILLGLIVLYRDDLNIPGSYGFRRIRGEDDKLIWLNKNEWFPLGDGQMGLWEKYDITNLGRTSRDFTTDPPEDIAFQTLLSNVKNRIENKTLDETENYGISLEKLFYLISKIGFFLGLPTSREERFLEKNLPFNIEKMQESLKIYTHDQDTGIILSPHRYSRDIISTQKINQILSTISKHENLISFPLLPRGDTPRYPGWLHINRSEDYSKKGIVTYVNEFFKKFLEEYKTLVEVNFPTFKNKLPTYNRLPLYVVAQLHKSSRHESADGLMYALLDHEGESNVFEIRDYDEEPFEVKQDPENVGFLIKTKDGFKHTTRYTNGMILNGLFTSYSGSNVFRDCPLTSFVYELLMQDFETLYGSNFGSF